MYNGNISHVDSRGHLNHQNDGEQPRSEAEDAMSVEDESMAGAEGASTAIKEVKTDFIPSTFAPPEYVEKIRARNEAAAKAALVNVVQTRSMTAKKSRDRRDVLRSSSVVNSSRSKTNVMTAHQACSPRTTLVRGKGAKVAAVDDTTLDCMDSPAPQVMTILGKRVTMIDPVRKVFVIDLLSPETCDQIRMMADNHTREVHKNGSKTETWRTLYTYTKMDLPVVEVKDLVKVWSLRSCFFF